MSCAFSKVRVRTDRSLGCDLPKMVGWRMMGRGEAEKHGLEGVAMECCECPYARTCPEVALR